MLFAASALREAQRVGVDSEVARGDQRLQDLLLALGVSLSAFCYVGDTQLFQRGARPTETRFARDVRLIDLGREARRIGKPLQRLPPRTLMGRIDKDAVHVEDDGGESSVGSRSCWHLKTSRPPGQAWLIA